MQDCSNSIANALEFLQSCTKPLKYTFAFAIISEHCKGTGGWIPSLWKTRISVFHSQYHPSCWWSGDLRSQGISSHGVDLVCMEYSSLSTTGVYTLRLAQNNVTFCRQVIQMHFLGKKVIVFCFKFYLKFFIPRVQLTVSQYWLGNCLTHWPLEDFNWIVGM